MAGLLGGSIYQFPGKRHLDDTQNHFVQRYKNIIYEATLSIVFKDFGNK